MKKVMVGCLIVFAVLVLILIIAIMLTPQSEKDRIAQERLHRKDTAVMLVNKVVNRFRFAQTRLPQLDEAVIGMHCPPVESVLLSLQPTSIKELKQYTESGFVQDTSLYHEPWLTRRMQIIQQNYGTSLNPDDWDIGEVIETCRQILATNYFTVHVPHEYAAPRMIDDKHFESGYFEGWVILVDAHNGKVMGYQWFEAINSKEIENFRLGVGVGPLSIPLTGKDIGSKVKEDFRNRFFEASDRAIGQMMTN